MAKIVKPAQVSAGTLFRLSRNLIHSRRNSENLINKIIKLEKDVEILELENQELKKRLKLHETKKK